MKRLRLIGFSQKGFRTAPDRDVVCRFIEWDSTWADLREIAVNLIEHTSYYLDPEILEPNGPIHELRVLDCAEDNWGYAVAAGVTNLTFERWAELMETQPIAIFEYED